MTDEELGRECAPSECPAYHLWLGASLKEGKRASLERLISVSRELQLWEAGFGPLPSGVIVTKATRRRIAL